MRSNLVTFFRFSASFPVVLPIWILAFSLFHLPLALAPTLLFHFPPSASQLALLPCLHICLVSLALPCASLFLPLLASGPRNSSPLFPSELSGSRHSPCVFSCTSFTSHDFFSSPSFHVGLHLYRLNCNGNLPLPLPPACLPPPYE